MNVRGSRRRHAVRAAFAVALVGLLACDTGPASKKTAAQPDSGRAGKAFRVALLTPGPISDRSWNGGAYDGLMAIRDSLGAQVSHVQTKTPAEFEDYGAARNTLRQFLDADAQLDALVRDVLIPAA